MTDDSHDQEPATPEFDDSFDLENALSRLSQVFTTYRRHERATDHAGLNIDRSGVVLLRALAECETAPRLRELATLIGVEAPAVTRQVQRLERAGLVERVVDPVDRRARRIRLTPAGRDASLAIRAVYCGWIHEAMANWTATDLHVLTVLNHRMVRDFLDHGKAVALLRRGPTPQDV